jgi:hypothetical protein
MVVDLDFDPATDTEFSDSVTKFDEKKRDKHQGKVVNLLNHYEKKYGFERGGMTSWAKVSATAFLTNDQVAKLANDKRVTLLSENEIQTSSAIASPPPPWSDTTVLSETRSWGWHATTRGISRASAATNSFQPIYIIDSGVAKHADIPGASKRVSMGCGNSLTNCSTGTSTDPYPLVGCYPHSTHVAGIIGALANNFNTSQGIYPGVNNIISVGINKASAFSAGRCADIAFTFAELGYAIDYVYRQTLMKSMVVNNGVPIVNISTNPGRFGFDSAGIAEANRAALLRLATPAIVFVPGGQAVSYMGAFVVQSAGNQPTQGRNLCIQYDNGQIGNFGASLAYTHALPSNNTTSTTDGIMVVGAVHSEGVPVDTLPTNRPFSAPNPAGQSGLSGTSNFGPCVDAWAPGNGIYSTWCAHSGPPSGTANVQERCNARATYSGSGVSGTQGWAFLSGTSMAAPNVAGAAAYLADTFQLGSPSAIEQKVRQYLFETGSNDRSSTALAPLKIRIVQLP